MAAENTQYDPKSTEEGIYKRWENSGVFRLDETKDGDPFVIMLPPPNITGRLHMGHALQDTIMDILIRWHRMRGEPTTWVPGTDSAAIATNRVITEQLAKEGLNRHDIGREKFLEKVDAWYKQTGSEIVDQMKRLGASCDWDRQRFTMDEDYIKAVNHAFIDYYNKGYIYRGNRIVNWDPIGQTTVSDLEIEYKTEKTKFYTFKYGPFEIGTARPETKFGDKYVVMHPDDERFAEYKHGDQFEAEWINGPVIATVIKDEAADPNMGTGAMTITPWHSVADFEIAERHNLDKEQIIDFDGRLLPIAEEFAGMTIEEAREKIVEKLDAKGLLVSVDENYEHNIALNDRGKGVLEPQIMKQWFVDMSHFKKAAIKAAKEDKVQFVPPRWKKHFISWMENVYDWNISRQIWLGHRIPAWFKDDEIKVQEESPGEEWVQDPDVLDTWFATALWSFAPLGWPEETSDLKKLHPTSVLVTARDILYLWVARMIFSSLESLGEVPFKEVFIHPTVLAKDGRRMSKSLGTGIDPLELIEEYGADATRFGLMYQMTYDSQAIKFDAEDVKSARNFANKIWNVANFLKSSPLILEERESRGEVIDTWIQSRYNQTAQHTSELLSQYKIGEAARELYQFIWQDYADWYIEILKTQGNPKIAKQIFVDTLKLLHPFMPFISEKLWQEFGKEGQLITTAWPEADDVSTRDTNSKLDTYKSIVSSTRSARVLFGLTPKDNLELYIPNELKTEVEELLPALSAMTRANIVDVAADNFTIIPVSDTGSIHIGSPALTEEKLAEAKHKLQSKQQVLENRVQKIASILENMQGKAPEDKITEKKNELAQAERELEETRKSVSILR